MILLRTFFDVLQFFFLANSKRRVYTFSYDSSSFFCIINDEIEWKIFLVCPFTKMNINKNEIALRILIYNINDRKKIRHKGINDGKFEATPKKKFNSIHIAFNRRGRRHCVVDLLFLAPFTKIVVAVGFVYVYVACLLSPYFLFENAQSQFRQSMYLCVLYIYNYIILLYIYLYISLNINNNQKTAKNIKTTKRATKSFITTLCVWWCETSRTPTKAKQKNKNRYFFSMYECVSWWNVIDFVVCILMTGQATPKKGEHTAQTGECEI